MHQYLFFFLFFYLFVYFLLSHYTYNTLQIYVAGQCQSLQNIVIQCVFNSPSLYARLETVRIMCLGMVGGRAGVHTGFRTITLVLYIRSLRNLAT